MCSCSYYSQPALPRHAGIENAASVAPSDELREVVERADVLYLPADRLQTDEQNGAALRLLNLLQQSTARVAIGWANIATTVQPAFDDWNSWRIPLDRLLTEIQFDSESQHDATRRLLRESRDRGIVCAPLRCSGGPSCTAENVMRESLRLQAGKLLVVIARPDLDSASGVPFFVGQRLQVRQVVFDVRPAEPRLLTRRGRATEIVYATPGAGRDRL